MPKRSVFWGICYGICAFSIVFDAIALWTRDIHPSDLRLSLLLVIAFLFFINRALLYFTGETF